MYKIRVRAADNDVHEADAQVRQKNKKPGPHVPDLLAVPRHDDEQNAYRYRRQQTAKDKDGPCQVLWSQ